MTAAWFAESMLRKEEVNAGHLHGLHLNRIFHLMITHYLVTHTTALLQESNKEQRKGKALPQN